MLTGNDLERGLRKINREDVIRKCMYNIEEVTDEMEMAAAKVQLDSDQAGKYLSSILNLLSLGQSCSPSCNVMVWRTVETTCTVERL